MTRRGALQFVAAASGVLAVAVAVRSLAEGAEAIDVRSHHLTHAVLILGGAAAALALTSANRRQTPHSEQPQWLLPAILAPFGGMVLMVPTFYPYMNAHPAVHVLAHLGFIVAGFVTAWCGERYRPKIGWATTLFLEAMAVGAAFGFGVTK
ncbi:MAG: hypothetical protein KGL31_08360 [candidate division NC10 bacterium]|nr:hypothetical protein [candidate division NC10 bacterium]MDE2321911.1 hypothetical protein [candidate division NC10 bacterium]